MRWLINLFKEKLVYNWETTHTNRWHHPTMQRCTKTGLSRRFEYFLPELPMSVKLERKIKCSNGMPWEKGRWVWSNGKQSKYCVLD